MSLADKLKGYEDQRPKWVPDASLLLGPQIPKPMHETNPRTILGNAWWERERRAAFHATEQHCAACGVNKYQAKAHKWLEGHESYDINYAKGTVKYVRTVGLCHYCHNYIHIGRLTKLVEKGETPHSKLVGVIQHGDRVLIQAGVKRPEPYNGSVAEWSKWRLVIGRKRYKGKFADFRAWCEHFGYNYAEFVSANWFNL